MKESNNFLCHLLALMISSLALFLTLDLDLAFSRFQLPYARQRIYLVSPCHRASYLTLDFTLLHPLLLIVFVYVAVLALSLGVHYFVRMYALGSQCPTTIPMVAVVAHALGEVLQVLMVACKDLSRLATTLGGPFNRGLHLLWYIGKPLFMLFVRLLGFCSRDGYQLSRFCYVQRRGGHARLN